MTKEIKLLVLLFLTCISLNACPIVRGAGNALEATGEGVAHAVKGTGDAIGQTGCELAN